MQTNRCLALSPPSLPSMRQSRLVSKKGVQEKAKKKKKLPQTVFPFFLSLSFGKVLSYLSPFLPPFLSVLSAV